jgi:signal transduction histidine kinase
VADGQWLIEMVPVWHAKCIRRGQQIGKTDSAVEERERMAYTGILGGTAERSRREAVVETLAPLPHQGESLGELAHDARNMVTALGLYCDLIEEPGVLAKPHQHYAGELRLLAEACRCLVGKLSLLGTDRPEDRSPARPGLQQGGLFPESGGSFAPGGGSTLDSLNEGLIDDFRYELLASKGLLAAIPGPAIRVTVSAESGAWPVRMSSENLIRALVNLVKNSAESIGGAGAIEIRLSEKRDADGSVRGVVLSLEDSGNGIGAEMLEKVFEPGFSTRTDSGSERVAFGGHRGLGLSITRSIVEAAGGRIHAETRVPQGTRFVIELPVREL